MTGPPVDITKPLVRLFLQEENTTQVTKGEAKAKQIEDSFKNPFQKFLPAKKFSEISTKNSKNNEDKTKSSEVSAKEGESGSKVSDDDVVEVAHRYTKAAERYTKTERYTKIPENMANATIKESKKRKQENPEASDENESATALRVKRHKKKSKKLKRATNNEETDKQINNTAEFVAYDYKNASLDFEKTENGEAGKDEVFNPYKKLKEKGKRFKSKVHMKSGERSMTFNKK